MIERLNVWLKRLPTWVVYVLAMLPAPVMFYQGITGQLGVDPVKALEHEYGELALKLMVLTLAVTPLRRYVGLNLLKFRRALGLLVFFYAACHLLVWLVLDVQILSQVLADILKRPYITIGIVSFVLMVPLAVTSNMASIRRLGGGWRKLHRLTYVCAVLAALHFVLLVKGFQVEPLIYLGLILGLLLLRLPFSRLSKTRLTSTNSIQG